MYVSEISNDRFDSFVVTTTLIYKYRLQWIWVERWYQTHHIRNMFDDSSGSNSLSCCCIYKKKKEDKDKDSNLNKYTIFCCVVPPLWVIWVWYMNTYKYQKLWARLESTHCSLLISGKYVLLTKTFIIL